MKPGFTADSAAKIGTFNSTGGLARLSEVP
jgi:hypothetical protein